MFSKLLYENMEKGCYIFECFLQLSGSTSLVELLRELPKSFTEIAVNFKDDERFQMVMF